MEFAQVSRPERLVTFQEAQHTLWRSLHGPFIFEPTEPDNPEAIESRLARGEQVISDCRKLLLDGLSNGKLKSVICELQDTRPATLVPPSYWQGDRAMVSVQTGAIDISENKDPAFAAPHRQTAYLDAEKYYRWISRLSPVRDPFERQAWSLTESIMWSVLRDRDHFREQIDWLFPANEDLGNSGESYPGQAFEKGEPSTILRLLTLMGQLVEEPGSEGMLSDFKKKLEHGWLQAQQLDPINLSRSDVAKAFWRDAVLVSNQYLDEAAVEVKPEEPIGLTFRREDMLTVWPPINSDHRAHPVRPDHVPKGCEWLPDITKGMSPEGLESARLALAENEVEAILQTLAGDRFSIPPSFWRQSPLDEKVNPRFKDGWAKFETDHLVSRETEGWVFVPESAFLQSTELMVQENAGYEKPQAVEECRPDTPVDNMQDLSGQIPLDGKTHAYAHAKLKTWYETRVVSFAGPPPAKLE
jgi:hypothetical protein